MFVHFCYSQFFDTAKFVDTLYIWSAFNTVKVGELIGQALAEFINYADVSQIHLVGEYLILAN